MSEGFRQRTHQFLASHLHKGPMVSHPEDGPNQRSRFAQIAAPVSTDKGSLNHFNMLAHGSAYSRATELDVTGAKLGSDYMTSAAPIPADGLFRSRATVATNLMSAAFYSAGGTPKMFTSAMKMMSTTGGKVQRGTYGVDDALGIRAIGQDMIGGIISADRAGRKTKGGKGKGVTTRPGTMAANSRKYWGLGEYLSDDQQSGFDDNVNPYFWAAPYISIRYPSGQVGSSA